MRRSQWGPWREVTSRQRRWELRSEEGQNREKGGTDGRWNRRRRRYGRVWGLSPGCVVIPFPEMEEN